MKTNLTGKLGVRFDDESSDTPEPARAYGSAGWTSGDRSVLLYDKYDIWEVRPDGTDARLVTGGFGRKNADRVPLRAAGSRREDLPDRQAVPRLGAERRTKATGFYRVTPRGRAAPRKPARGKTAAPRR